MPTHPILGQPTRALPHDHVACDSFWCARCMLHAIARAALPLLCCLSYRALKVLTRCRLVPIILMPTPHTILWLEEDPICACEYLCVWACVCICVRVCVRVRVCVCVHAHMACHFFHPTKLVRNTLDALPLPFWCSTVTDMSVNPLGLVIAGVSVVTSGLQQMLCGVVQRKHNITSNQLLSNTAPIQVRATASVPGLQWPAIDVHALSMFAAPLTARVVCKVDPL